VTALSPDSTIRFRVFYTNCSHQHSLQVRSGSSPAVVGSLVDSFFTALGNVISATVIDFVDFAASGSSVFNPVTTGIEGNTYAGFGGGTTVQAAQYIDYVGRTAGGRRVRWSVFGIGNLFTDFRAVSAENAQVDAGRAILAGAGAVIIGIDGLIPSWKTYANTGVNAHWQKALRP